MSALKLGPCLTGSVARRHNPALAGQRSIQLAHRVRAGWAIHRRAGADHWNSDSGSFMKGAGKPSKLDAPLERLR